MIQILQMNIYCGVNTQSKKKAPIKKAKKTKQAETHNPEIQKPVEAPKPETEEEKNSEDTIRDNIQKQKTMLMRKKPDLTDVSLNFIILYYLANELNNILMSTVMSLMLSGNTADFDKAINFYVNGFASIMFTDADIAEINTILVKKIKDQSWNKKSHKLYAVGMYALQNFLNHRSMIDICLLNDQELGSCAKSRLSNNLEDITKRISDSFFSAQISQKDKARYYIGAFVFFFEVLSDKLERMVLQASKDDEKFDMMLKKFRRIFPENVFSQLIYALQFLSADKLKRFSKVFNG